MTDYTATVDRLFAEWLQTAEANLNTDVAIVESLQRTSSDLEVANKYGDKPRAALLERKFSHLAAQLAEMTPENTGGELDTQPEE